MPLHHMQKGSWGWVTQLTLHFGTVLLETFGQDEGFLSAQGLPVPTTLGGLGLSSSEGGNSLLHGPEGWNNILAPQWDYTPSPPHMWVRFRILQSRELCMTGVAQEQLCQAFAMSGHAGTAVLQLGMPGCSRTDWKAAVKLRFSPGM